MSNNNKVSSTTTSITFEKFALVLDEDKNHLTVTFNPEWEKVAQFDGTQMHRVNGILSALAAEVKGTYVVVESDLILRYALEQLEDELSVKNAGYARGDKLLALKEEGLVRRFKEIEPDEWYRLRWDIDGFTTEDMPYMKFDALEGDWVKHNRNAKNMIAGFAAIRKARAKNLNIGLSWFDSRDKYVDERLVDLRLRAEGKVKEADERYRVKVTGSRIGRQIYRTTKRMELPEEEQPVLDVSQVRLHDGTIVAFDDVKGRMGHMVIGNIEMPIPQEINEVTADTVTRNKGAWVLIEA